jgi:hypothetical protein
MNFPVVDPFELGELLLRRFDSPFGIRGRSNHERALAAAEELIVSRDFIYEAHPIARHFYPRPVVASAILPPRASGSNDLNQFVASTFARGFQTSALIQLKAMAAGSCHTNTATESARRR